MDGLHGRTSQRTVPNMIGRHQTHLDHDLATVVNAFNERLAGSTVTRRTDPPRQVSPLDLRHRLAMPASAGLRERLLQSAPRTA
jgi:hypothetical protein